MESNLVKKDIKIHQIHSMYATSLTNAIHTVHTGCIQKTAVLVNAFRHFQNLNNAGLYNNIKLIPINTEKIQWNKY